MTSIFTKNKLLPLVFVVAGLLLGYFILTADNKKPGAYQKNKIKRYRTVEISPLVKGNVEPFWNTTGFVIPSETVQINTRVSGNIMAINPIAMPGGHMKKGQWLAKLETIDLELALKSEQAQLEQAKANFSLEQAEQILAKEELLLLNSQGSLEVDESLVLREPQLTVAKARISVAENDVEKAALNLARAEVFMPFSGKVIKKNVGIGSKVSTNTSLFSVVNTDVYWLEVKIPHKFLTLLDKQQTATLFQPRLWGENKKGENKTRHARFVSILPELDTKDRQVKVLLAIDNPQAELPEQPPVFINDFLNVTLKGKPINNAWTIQHPWLQADNTIWVVDSQSTLQKRPVNVLFKGREFIYVDADIKPGDRALAEKPGIASIGLPVKVKKSRANTVANLDKVAQPNKPTREQPAEKQVTDKKNKAFNKNEQKQVRINHER